MSETIAAGRRVLITGGASGIGAAIAARCIEDGLEPVVIDRVGDGILADLSDMNSTARAGRSPKPRADYQHCQ